MSGDEIIAIVDENNQVVGAASRQQMRQQGLIHRASYILVFNSNGHLFVQKRTRTKDIYPGYYDVAAGGVVLAGESYEQSAARELEEELGIREIPLISHFVFFHQSDNNQVWGAVFSCVYDGAMRLQAEEVESGAFYPPERIRALSADQPFTPDGIYVLNRYLESQAGDRSE